MKIQILYNENSGSVFYRIHNGKGSKQFTDKEPDYLCWLPDTEFETEEQKRHTMTKMHLMNLQRKADMFGADADELRKTIDKLIKA